MRVSLMSSALPAVVALTENAGFASPAPAATGQALLHEIAFLKNVRKQSHVGVLAIVLAYALFGGLWILLSDRAMGLLFRDPEALVRASMVKGWFYVAVTTVLLYVLVKRFADALVASHLRELALERERQKPPPMLVAIAEASTDAIFAKDEEGRYLLFNNAAARIVGKTPGEVVGKGDDAIFPAAQVEQLRAADRHAMATGETQSQEEILHTMEGERIFLAIKGPLRGGDGRVIGTYGISRDITERKRAETLLRESQERLRVLVDHAPVALAMLDRKMNYLEASQLWCSTVLGGQTDIIGRSHDELLPAFPESWREAHARGLAGEIVVNEEDRYETPQGGVRWLRWEVRPWRQGDGAVGGILIFAENISQRMISEMELRDHNRELEHFNRVATERELRMIALKREVNEMARLAGRPAQYDTSFVDGSAT
jgi:PAS domain S-box-containing protein